MDENRINKSQIIFLLSSIGGIPLLLMIFTLFAVVLFLLGYFEPEEKENTFAQGGYKIVCEENAAQLLAKMLYLEVNGTDMFTKLTTAAVIINNAKGTSYNQIHSLTDEQYHLFSSYKDTPFEEYVPESARGELLYVAETVLSGKYTLPSNIIYQASQSIVEKYGDVWTSIPATPKDVYFGYTRGESLSGTDILGNNLPGEAYSSVSESVAYYKKLAVSLEQSDYSSYNSSSICKVAGGECGFTISETSLSKSEFKRRIQDYANNHSQWQIFADNANDYYDYAKAKGVNPELVVTVAAKEGGGKETGGTNNYWGLECPNGSSFCGNYSSFMEGAKKLIDSASKYDSLTDWFVVGSYSYIGYFWYNPGSWGSGGCVYAPYIYGDNMPERVKKACSGSKCYITGSDQSLRKKWVDTGVNPRPECTPTTDDDQLMYTKYLIKDKMGTARKDIFGLEYEEGVSCTPGVVGSSSSIVESYVQWMIEFAADDSHGYSQNTRYMNPNVDCSSFVYYGLLKGAGFGTDKIGNSAFATSSMINILKQAGFKTYTYNSQDELQRGDILWRSGHTEVYIGNGQNVGAHSNYDGKDGDSSGREVNVSTNSGKFTLYLRYES